MSVISLLYVDEAMACSVEASPQIKAPNTAVRSMVWYAPSPFTHADAVLTLKV